MAFFIFVDKTYKLSQHLWIFLVQLIIIIVTSRIVGTLFKKIGQPFVMGEIMAGIFLGPSLLGGIFPKYLQFVFPPGSLDNMRILSQIGLMLFMFVIGMELDVSIIKKKARSALIISNASIVFPFGLGLLLSYFLHDHYANPDTPFYAFAFFMGIAMSITAFPVLARIIKERKFRDNRLESITLTSAAINDVTGWCLLAFVIAIVQAGSFQKSLFTIGATLVYIFIMLLVVRPLLKRLTSVKTSPILKQSNLAIILITMLLSALCTELIGIHALFGAFMAGIIMPVDMEIRQPIINKIEDVALILLLPLFFVITGLRTEIGSLNTPVMWAVCLLIIVFAVAGKFGGSALAAKFTGENNHDSMAIGALMNTRGLMELVVLNIGYDLDILTHEVFTMMVIMALVTTLMTNPLLNLLQRMYKKQKSNSGNIEARKLEPAKDV